MNYVLDLAVILIVLGTVLTYYKKGFVRAVLGFGKVILAALISALFGKGLGVIIDGRYMNARVTDSVFGSISKMYDAGSSVFDLSKLAEKIPSSLATLAERCGWISACSQYAGTRRRRASGFARSRCNCSPNLGLNLKDFGLCAGLCGSLSGADCRLYNREGGRAAGYPFGQALGLLLGLVCAVVYTFLFVLATNAVIYFVVASGDQSANACYQ